MLARRDRGEVNNPAIRDALWSGLYTGMRRDEVLTLRWERVDIDALTFRVEETKTGVPLELPITSQLAAILERRRTAASESARRRSRVGVPLADQRDRTRPGPASPLRPHQQGRGRQVLVPRPAQFLHHGRRARADAASFAHQAPGQPRRPNDVTQGYAADWTIAQLREPAQKIADRIETLMHETQAT